MHRGVALFASQARLFCGVCLALLAGTAALGAAEKSDRPPNVIFILADDYGWRDIGCFGSTFYETPNLDKLAADGMRFTDAYAACNVCSPTRASIMSGKYPARLHLTDWLPGQKDMPAHKLNRPIIIDHLPIEEVTIANAMKDAGYVTGMFGKWHLGGPEFYPEKRGFDVNVGGCEMGHPPSYFSPYKIPTIADGPKGEYLTDRLTDEALKFIEKNKSHPFYIYFPHYAVHTPLQAKSELLAKYTAKAAKLPKPDGPEFLPEGKMMCRQYQNVPVYAAMIQSLDESIGRIMQKLDELGLDQNTMIFFTSDNGGLSTAEGSPTSNVPLRAGKGWNYEGGFREPTIVKWPGVTKPGSVCADPLISTDYYPTILEAAGLPARPQQHVDGVSIVPMLRGGTRPIRPLFWHYPHYSNQGGSPGGAVRLGDWKLLEWYEDNRVELYNLKDDQSEKNDLSAKSPEKVNELRTLLHQWRTDVKADMPTPNPNYDPNAVPEKGAKKIPAAKKGKKEGAGLDLRVNKFESELLQISDFLAAFGDD